MSWKNLFCVVAFILILASGCQIVSDLWPVRVPKTALTYLEKPDMSIIQSLGDVKEIRNEVINKHLESQLGLEHQMSLDKIRYDGALEQTNFNIQTATAERDMMIGTIDKPGWLLSILLGASGLGLYITGARKQRPEDYNESEMQIEVEKRLAIEAAKLNKNE